MAELVAEAGEVEFLDERRERRLVLGEDRLGETLECAFDPGDPSDRLREGAHLLDG